MTTEINWLRLQKDLQPKLLEGKINDAIEFCEKELNKIPQTDFHKILTKNLDHLIDPLILWINDFYKRVSQDININAMYCEMNGFTINPDRWFIDLFAFDTDGGMEDLDWLADWQNGHSTLPNSFTITGFEDLQTKYESKANSYDDQGNSTYDYSVENRNADVYCQHIIVLRLQELFKNAIIIAKNKNYVWADTPIIVTGHDWEMIYKTK